MSSLPKQFVIAMKTLFDIMDDNRTGFVKLSDIENRWRDDGTKGLPKGMIECLKNIAPADDLLTFDQFCSGLKICLLKNQENTPSFLSKKSVQVVETSSNVLQFPQPQCPQSVTTLKTQINPNLSQMKTVLASTVQGDSQLPVTIYSQIFKEGNGFQLDNPEYYFSTENMSKYSNNLCAPPKPPRITTGFNKNMHTDRLESHERTKWQVGQSMNDVNSISSKHLLSHGELALAPNSRGMADGKSAVTDIPTNLDRGPPVSSEALTNLFHKKPNVRRREPRRHTLQNGIDYNMLKRMKKIEQEKDILIQGLAAVDKARDWYLKQMERIQEKIRFLGRMGSHMEQWTEAQQERLELQRARVFELNRQLEALAECWQRGGLSLHMNLAISPQQQNANSAPSNGLVRLQQQNQLLTEDIMKKQERITVLEMEKSSLIRELLQFRNRGNKSEIF